MTRAQLLELGLSPGAVAHRVRVGRLVAAHRGIYGVGHLPGLPAARAAAAVLACGPGALLSHGSAATLWGIVGAWRFPLEVTVAGGDRRPRGIVVHRCRTLTRADVRTHLGIRVTSPARTILDIAPGLADQELTRVVNDVRHRGQLHVGALSELLRRCTGHPGAKRLSALAGRSGGPTRSRFEDAFVAFAERHGLPAPDVNTHLLGYEVDALFKSRRVIVELDGWDYHRDRGAFEHDRERDAVMLAAGYRTVRITWDRLHYAAEREAGRLHRILAEGGP